MIPQSFKDILSEGNSHFQIISMILFMILFAAIVWYVMNKPKTYYKEEASTPLEDNDDETIDYQK
ncbi:CcoQ/FixQ family Cbb3-type cytochrome c oxidase assembly chaperone [Riemerella columbipharyngis]|uniref:Cbb3-type cytochrome oxidase component FixQ n=1 Tax=Riemerella columbipharyngis TaxID=1071918 RepID=A0A1G7E5A7_9FLAO|nr:CcoQ/FixQ family Cbb3-type cytochrome c oxidase assembly chaperone [Riemerella columbipharyngis]SDE58894.1 hypothetical protein SAMN05421544_11427 [Riemerella columbipharyngis]